MRKKLPEILELGRVTEGEYRSDTFSSPNGFFQIKGPKSKLNIIASNGMGWEHVSVAITNSIYKVPSWKEMCFVKDLFWEEDEWVIQYHPAKKDYVNNHPSVLHLWKPINTKIPTPPSILVGIK